LNHKGSTSRGLVRVELLDCRATLHCVAWHCETTTIHRSGRCRSGAPSTTHLSAFFFDVLTAHTIRQTDCHRWRTRQVQVCGL
jgi:hypothetical protein